MKHFDLVVTRHKGLIDYLDSVGITYSEVIQHVQDVAQLSGKNVLGVLPVAMAEKCETFTELALEIPQELRG
jgi:putative CRISPR-associated protein (TIGR02620 family)